jgi:mRNA interferase RelE/StbE
MKYVVVVDAKAEREISRLDFAVQERVNNAIAALADDPRPPGSRKLVGYADQWRIRIGDYRVVYHINDAIITVRVLKAGHRGKIYR